MTAAVAPNSPAAAISTRRSRGASRRETAGRRRSSSASATAAAAPTATRGLFKAAPIQAVSDSPRAMPPVPHAGVVAR